MMMLTGVTVSMCFQCVGVRPCWLVVKCLGVPVGRWEGLGLDALGQAGEEVGRVGDAEGAVLPEVDLDPVVGRGEGHLQWEGRERGRDGLCESARSLVASRKVRVGTGRALILCVLVFMSSTVGLSPEAAVPKSSGTVHSLSSSD